MYHSIMTSLPYKSPQADQALHLMMMRKEGSPSHDRLGKWMNVRSHSRLWFVRSPFYRTASTIKIHHVDVILIIFIVNAQVCSVAFTMIIERKVMRSMQCWMGPNIIQS